MRGNEILADRENTVRTQRGWKHIDPRYDRVTITCRGGYRIPPRTGVALHAVWSSVSRPVVEEWIQVRSVIVEPCPSTNHCIRSRLVRKPNARTEARVIGVIE